MMKRILLALAVLAAPAAEVHAQAADARSLSAPVRISKGGHKVTAPVDVQIVALPDPGPGMRRVRITARPSVDAASLSIDVHAESGLALATPSSASWTLPARAGEEVTRELDLAVSGAGELRLVVTATIKHGEDFTQSGIHVFAFNPAPEAALPKSLGAAPATDPGGRTILEVPARRP